MAYRLFLLFISTLYLAGCSPVKKALNEVADQYHYHVGFYLYDPATKKELLNINGNKYFTPASNTKVYTLYSVIHALPDSIPAFRYVVTDTVIYVWGLADPSFLNPLLPQGKTYSFLTQSTKISLSNSHFYDDRFGPGWAWDDYLGDYSQEKTSFPVYGNSIVFNIDSISKQTRIEPAIFSDSVTIKQAEKYRVWRAELSNRFEWDTAACLDCERIRPIHFSEPTLQRLLEDTLKIPVVVNNLPLPDSAQTFYSIPTDSVLKVMMQDSDNFMAEHLLLSCAAKLTDSLSSQVAIEHLSKKINTFLPDPIVWKDGSGLSRYNLFTPRDMVFMWNELFNELGRERLLALIAGGGKSGTLEEWFAADEPYVFGKSGTLSNNYSLSGFLITKSGKRLIFAYMNNNYPVKAVDIKKEMEVVLRKVYEKY